MTRFGMPTLRQLLPLFGLALCLPDAALAKKPPEKAAAAPGGGAPQYPSAGGPSMAPVTSGAGTPGKPTPAPPPPPPPLRPNLYELKSGPLAVTYSTGGLDGKAHLHYQDAATDEQFSGDQVRTQATEIGELVSVTIRRTVDSGSTSFSLLVPSVILDSATEVATVNAVGITTVHRFSPVLRFNRGQLDNSQVAILNGTGKRAR